MGLVGRVADDDRACPGARPPGLLRVGGQSGGRVHPLDADAEPGRAGPQQALGRRSARRGVGPMSTSGPTCPSSWLNPLTPSTCTHAETA